jgi:hypothetical protein
LLNGSGHNHHPSPIARALLQIGSEWLSSAIVVECGATMIVK